MTEKKKTEPVPEPVDEQAIIVDSLAMRVAQLAVEVAQWRARAIAAEGVKDDTDS